jgi:uncharacterized repeat protein (TIGR03803 family)
MKLTGSVLFVVFTGFVVIALIGSQASAQTFNVVYSFSGNSDGANPLAGLLLAQGDFYGTTSAGGNAGTGVVFKIDSSGGESVVYSFAGGSDGASPEAGLLWMEGALFGATTAGGSNGAGTVFRVLPSGKEKVLYSFTGGADGADPQGTLTKDAAGNLYGTTFAGGASGNGAVFELVHPAVTGGAWTEKVLYSFGTGTDGINPVAGVTFDSAGNLYGTASAGGSYGYGTVFQLVPSASGWSENILHQFALQNDGGVPYAGIVVNKQGRLWGAATDGGTGGGGTVFELTPASGGGWTFDAIYSVPGWGISGSFRNILLSNGKIYATTHCDGSYDAGTVYELTRSGSTWNATSLYVFTGGTDGLYSFSSLVFDSDGNLWGTTKQGGANGEGVIFKVTP